MKHKLPKLDLFWAALVFAALGIAAYILRFFENIIEDYIPHLAALSVSLLVVALVLFILSGPINWFKRPH